MSDKKGLDTEWGRIKENPQNKLQEFLERFEEESFEDFKNFEEYEDGDEKKFLLN